MPKDGGLLVPFLPSTVGVPLSNALVRVDPRFRIAKFGLKKLRSVTTDEG